MTDVHPPRILIAELAPGSFLQAEASGLAIMGPTATQPTSSLGRKLLPLLPQLEQLGLAARNEDGSWQIPYNALPELYEDATSGEALLDVAQVDPLEFGLLADLPPISPLTVAIDNSAFLASKELRLDLSFRQGARQVYPRRVGAFIDLGGLVFRLPQSLYRLCEAVEAFNALPAGQG
jgi:hypothetical protein